MQNKIMVILIKPDVKTKEIKYIMVEKPLGKTKLTQLEFPSSKEIYDKTPEKTAKAVVLAETGYNIENIKFLYTLFINPQLSEDKVSVYMGLTLDKELSNKVVELDGDEILKKITDNEIIDSITLAAFAAILLKSSEAKKYLMKKNEG